MMKPAAAVALMVGLACLARLQSAEPAAEPKAAPPAAKLDLFGDPLPTHARLRLGTMRFRQGTPLTAIRFLPDGKRLVSAGSDQVLRFWDAANGRELYRFGDPISTAPAGLNPFAPPGAAVIVDELIAAGSNGVALSPDGGRVASMEGDFTFKIWEPQTRKLLLQVGKPLVNGGSRNFPTFSSDGKLLGVIEYDGTGVNNAIVVFDAATGKEKARLTGPAPDQEGQQPYQPTSYAFSPDGKFVFSMGNEAGAANKIRVWNLETLKQVEMADSSNINPLFVNGGATLWDGMPNRMFFVTPDSTKVGVVITQTDQENGNNFFSVRLWEAATGKKLRDIAKLNEGVTGLTFAPDGQSFALLTNNVAVRVLDVQTGKERHTLTANNNVMVTGLAYAPDGKTVAVGSADGTIQIFDTAKGESVRELHAKGNLQALLGGQVGQNATLSYAPDGKVLAVANGSMVQLWDPTTGKEIRAAGAAHAGEVGDIVVSPDGKTAVTAGNDNTVRIWDLATGQQLRLLDGPTGNNNIALMFGLAYVRQGASLAFSRDGKLLAIGWADGAIDVHDMKAGKRVHQLKGHNEFAITGLAFAPNGRNLVSSGQDGRILWWDATTGKMVRLLVGKPIADEANPDLGIMPVTMPVTMALSADGRTLAIASPDLTGGLSIDLHEIATAQVRRKIRVRGDGSIGNFFPQQLVLRNFGGGLPAAEGGGISISALRYTPDGKALLLTTGATTRLIDLTKGKEVRRFGGQEGVVANIAMTPDGKLLAAAGSDATVQLWDVATGTVVGQLVGHRGSVDAVAFTPDGQTLVSGGADTTGLVWDLPNFLEETRQTAKPAAGAALGGLWKQLGHENAEQADEAVRRLTAAPQAAVPLLREHVKVAPPTDAQRIARLVADLESDRFDVRKLATQSLERLGELSETALRKRLADNPPLEVRQRVDQLLEKLAGPVTDPERLRQLRAIEVLEHIGTPEARAVLETIAKGAPEARLTQEARDALERLNK